VCAVYFYFCTLLGPSSPSSSLQVTKAQNGLPIILARQRNSRTLDRQLAVVWQGVLAFSILVTDIGLSESSSPNSVSTVGLHQSAKLNLTKCIRL